MDINQKLKQRRLSLNLTMLELSKKVGVSEATISRWESGDIANMKRDKIVMLANALQVTPSFIMGRTDEPTDSGEASPAPTTHILKNLSDDETKLVTDYRQLNANGRGKAREYVSDLTENAKYTNSDVQNKLA